jgi:hypothetical protein
VLVNAEDEWSRFVAGKQNCLKVVDITANLYLPWEVAARKLEDADLVSHEKPCGDGIAKPLVGTKNDPSA